MIISQILPFILTFCEQNRSFGYNTETAELKSICF